MGKRTGVKNHTHKYYRRDDGLWQCAECTHFMPSNMGGDSAQIGKISRCWGCNKEYVMMPEHMTEERPVCKTCKMQPYTNEELDQVVALRIKLNKMGKLPPLMTVTEGLEIIRNPWRMKAILEEKEPEKPKDIVRSALIEPEEDEIEVNEGDE